MRQQEVWFIGGKFDTVELMSYPLPDPKVDVILPFFSGDGFQQVLYERVGLDVYLAKGIDDG